MISRGTGNESNLANQKRLCYHVFYEQLRIDMKDTTVTAVLYLFLLYYMGVKLGLLHENNTNCECLRKRP
jgi:hypothetical protein